ncbi:MAG: Fe-S cluster assembly ATPase SufC [Dictyoglomus sp.]|nr:Fe-S cluster assembly ATPase SufC [Dictyoglomus sp.]MCX7942196.1 Fe-S cluster assembly ATPase SufC [Dictyoglomaceae bacterium]MDW8188659.1 Fe-S cluster assembly ATPase SufC [Dictyoglomus sp.]
MKEILLEAKNLSVSIGEKNIIQKLNFKLTQGVHLLLGPNGSGKSTLLGSIMGLEKFKISGEILWKGENITNLSPDKRFKKGIFLAYQLPPVVRGVRLMDILKKILNINPKADLPKEIYKYLEDLELDESFLEREVNHGFSGGERKKSEILQVLLAKPELALLDEPDSGVDIDSLKLIGKIIQKISEKSNLLIVSHNLKILDYVNPDSVLVLIDGKFIYSDGIEIIHIIEERGYDFVRRKLYVENLSLGN